LTKVYIFYILVSEGRKQKKRNKRRKKMENKRIEIIGTDGSSDEMTATYKEAYLNTKSRKHTEKELEKAYISYNEARLDC
jgi:predicted N-acyltransferase